jgi:D-alanyl-lipoteichoic acid acyltransferase DltB (MBOAT superfamily)
MGFGLQKRLPAFFSKDNRMLFNSFQFLIFFPIAVLAFYLTPQRLRWLPALIASYYFYMCWKPAFAVLILTSTATDYLVGLGLNKYQTKVRRRLLLSASLVVNLGLLFTFKYLDFSLTNVDSALKALGFEIVLPYPELVLPVGISFYTFQTLSYTIDVYQRKIPTEYHFGRFALYVSYFPQLVAGPIERANRLLPQLKNKSTFSLNRLSSGLRLILWGLFKKMCVADLVATPVATIYANPTLFDGSFLLLGTLLFAIQIYCDFSGYSDIAIGCARIMGIDLMINFRQPYFAKSFTEFWQRWHISLTTWFRDYVYIPLGGKRCSKNRWVINILIVFIVSGIWHGAAWTFIAWALLHAIYLLGERMLRPYLITFSKTIGLDRLSWLQSLIQVFVTFSLVTIAWVFFRAQTFSDAINILVMMSDWSRFNLKEYYLLGLNTFEMMLCFLMPILMIFIDYCIGFKPRVIMKFWEYDSFRSLSYVTGLYLILLFGVFERVDFIYFQF